MPRPIAALGLAFALALLSAAPRAPEGTPSALDADPSGWTDLLADAGPELKGWTRLPVKPGGKLDEKSQWSLEGGILTCKGDGGHDWMRWDRELADFVYHVEWKFTPVGPGGKEGYNSGAYVRNSADAKVWHQAQVGPGPDAYLFGESPASPGGPLKPFNLAKAQADKRVRPPGEWNTFEITCKGKDLDLWVNGEVTSRFQVCEMPRGFVGLEAEGYRIEFRNVKIKPL